MQKDSWDDTLEPVEPVAAVKCKDVGEQALEKGGRRFLGLLVDEFPDVCVEMHWLRGDLLMEKTRAM